MRPTVDLGDNRQGMEGDLEGGGRASVGPGKRIRLGKLGERVWLVGPGERKKKVGEIGEKGKVRAFRNRPTDSGSGG